jgi:phage tail sheath protein FI
MARYYSPGVYVEEISTLAPSVAQVATAIPAFIGFTEKGSGVKRIDTLLDFETNFGKYKPSKFSVTVKETPDGGAVLQEITTVDRADADSNNFLMYYGLSLYFLNGGGSCYIISIGNYDSYDATGAKQAFEDGLKSLELEDEPTLIVLLDAVNLGYADYYALCHDALDQCKKLQDRFLIADVKTGDNNGEIPVDSNGNYHKTSTTKIKDWKFFRNKMSSDYLNYGAAYHPYLNTLLNYQYNEEDVSISFDPPRLPATGSTYLRAIDKAITVTYTGTSTSPKLAITVDTPATPLPENAKVDFATSPTNGTLTVTLSRTTPPTGAEAAIAWAAWKANSANDAAGFNIQVNGDGSAVLVALASTNLTVVTTLQTLKAKDNALYGKIKLAMGDQRVTLPPSPAIAGVYVRVDRDRGVWKAPANVTVASVVSPVVKISNNDQDLLNIDPDAGKSINAIRDFTGKGTLVWGSRTLAGNDNEWRYVPVRRLFITIEESTRKATSFAVFEPNDATTWLKVKAMIESYLYGLWEQGALAGPKPESAYFVNVGLGKTMTTQDILEGRMNVEIGIAAVRPAEFIILRFSHKLQQA